MKIVLFEDSYCDQLNPVNTFYHTAKIKIGMSDIAYKYNQLDPNPIFIGRSHFQSESNLDPHQEYLFINARLIPDSTILALIKSLVSNNPEFDGKQLALFLGKYDNFNNALQRNIDEDSTKFRWIHYPWDIITFNSEQIEIDAEHFYPTTQIVDDASKLKNVHIDHSNGQVYVHRDAIIQPFVYIKGPVFIDAQTVVKPHSTIINSSIHFNCRVSGEISSSIINDFTNKGHYGFLGHSLLGNWVNLGAGTTNSNLKNNYGSIRANNGHGLIDTNLTFLGLIMGDHSKTAIGTLFNTGTVSGSFSNIFEDVRAQKFIPSFTWGGNSSQLGEIDKLISSAHIYMARRNMKLNQADIEMIKDVYEASKDLK